MEEKICPYHLPPGTELAGRYQIGGVLGEGGFGITYAGMDCQLDVKVAIKEYFPMDKATRLAANSLEVVQYAGAATLFEKGLERFWQEARSLAKMGKLKEIVGVTDYFRENGTAYIVMEFVEGITFKELAAQYDGRVPAKELLPLVEPLLLSLGKMHQMGLIHRDISPDNLMLEDGAVRLLDLGSAREPGDGNSTVTVMLKRDYAPLEQYLGKEQGPWTDVYALCATLYYCLTGQAPPPSIDRLGGEKLPAPRELGADITLAQEWALLRGMKLQPRRRFQSMDELHAALFSTPKKEGTQKKRRHLSLWMGIGGGLALLFLVFLLTSRSLAPVETNAPPVSSAATQTESEPADSHIMESSPPSPAPVVSATPVTKAGSGFAAQMEDESVDSITIEAGTRLMVTERVTITKPVCVEPGAVLSLAGYTVVAGEGRLEIQGELRVETLLQLTGGGSAHVSAEGTLTMNGYCWMEQEGDLLMDKEIERDSHFIVVDEEAIFQNAVHVNSFSEYREALQNGSEAIVVDSDMEIPGMGETHQMPVLISEGVTVTGSIPSNGGVEASSWNVDATLLVNHGTILADLKLNDWGGKGRPLYVINHGRIEGRGYLEVPGLLLNLGEMRTIAVYVRGTDFCNVGSLTTSRGEQEGGIHIEAGRTLYNGGSTYSEGIGDAPSPIAVEQGGHLFNSGTMEFGQTGWIVNETGAEVVSVGTVRFLEGSQLINSGTFYNLGGTVELPGETTGNLPEERDYW